MKKLIALLTVSLAFVACNNNSAEKQQDRQEEIQSAMNAAVDSVNDINARERMIDSMNTASEQGKVTTEVKETPAKSGGTRSTKKDKEVTTNEKGDSKTVTGSTTTTSDGAGSTKTVATTETKEEPAAEEKKKKGLNNAAKGAIIGAGAGAIGGAIINKENRGKGAIIGGAVGAGAGAVTGVILDKRKKKREAAADSASKNTTTKEPATKEVP